MEIQKSALVLADISGYTRFVVLHRLNILHAEQIITELMEAIASKARYPLRLNKLEGDAAFFVAPIAADDDTALDDVIGQASEFFTAFRNKQVEQVESTTGGCPCDACQTLEKLRLKVVVHVGEVVKKKVGEFDEVAGESVIIAHRLLKNSIESNEYLLITKDVADAISFDPFEKKRAHTETVDQFGDIETIVYLPEEPPATRLIEAPIVSLKGVRGAMSTSWNTTLQLATGRRRSFRNLPS